MFLEMEQFLIIHILKRCARTEKKIFPDIEAIGIGRNSDTNDKSSDFERRIMYACA